VKQWSRAFEGIDLLPPWWYSTSDDIVFSSMVFGDQFIDMSDSWSQSISTPSPIFYSTGTSSSSDSSGFGGSFSGSSDSGGSWDSGGGGFSGGGDSGGGSGGGGGDSW
jgi:hypothetical protein